MVFAHKEIAHLGRLGLETRTFMFDAGANPMRALIRARELRRLVREYRPDIVHAHYGSLTAFVCAVATRGPLVITCRGSDLNPSPMDGPLRSVAQKLLSHLAVWRASAIICVSRRLRDRLWWCKDKAVVIPTGIDMEQFRPIPKREARKHLGWEDNERVVLFNAGRTPKVKRLDLAESSVAVMRQRTGEVRFVMLVGDTPHQEIPMYLSGADCLLMTSDHEGSPDIIKEALACDLPIVSVDVGDVSERLEGVRPSKIVPRDPHAIGSAAADIVLSEQKSNGREVVKNISATAVRDKIVELYRRVLRSEDQADSPHLIS